MLLSAFAVSVLIGAGAAGAGDVSSSDIVKALQSGSKTRSITATAQPQLDDGTRRLIDSLRRGGTREIVVEERKQIATAVDTSGLPRIDLTIPFEFDSAEITQAALPVLETLGRALQDPALASSQFIVGGHTDASGSDGYNLKLSQRRAEAIRHYLMQTFAIDERRLVAIGFGEMQLKNSHTPDAAENRRVQLVNLGN
jgi:outer membrane protein OmpA-like peptidoglycan-associated protein